MGSLTVPNEMRCFESGCENTIKSIVNWREYASLLKASKVSLPLR
jgi:hypothetical protein